MHGRLYISQNWLCFYANIFGWETFVSIHKLRSQEMLYPVQGVVVGISMGGWDGGWGSGVLKAKFCKGKDEAKLEFPEGCLA